MASVMLKIRAMVMDLVAGGAALLDLGWKGRMAGDPHLWVRPHLVKAIVVVAVVVVVAVALVVALWLSKP